MKFRPHPKSEDRKRSAVVLIELLLANKKPEILPEHLRELLDTLLWKITEANGKYMTRHQSAAALVCKDKSQLRHDHVYPRQRMIDALLEAKAEELVGIINDAVGCTVTIDEHRLLSAFDGKYNGWERYRKAKVAVTNTETGEQEISIDPE